MMQEQVTAPAGQQPREFIHNRLGHLDSRLRLLLAQVREVQAERAKLYVQLAERVGPAR